MTSKDTPAIMFRKKLSKKQANVILGTLFSFIGIMSAIAIFSTYVMFEIRHDYLGINIDWYVAFAVGFAVCGFFLMVIGVIVSDHISKNTHIYISQKESTK